MKLNESEIIAAMPERGSRLCVPVIGRHVRMISDKKSEAWLTVNKKFIPEHPVCAQSKKEFASLGEAHRFADEAWTQAVIIVSGVYAPTQDPFTTWADAYSQAKVSIEKLKGMTSCDKERLTAWEQRIKDLEESLPRGAGFDDKIEVLSVDFKNMSFRVPFHVHAEHGYDGWAEFMVTVKAEFSGAFDISITANRPDVSSDYDFVAETFQDVLSQKIQRHWWIIDPEDTYLKGYVNGKS